MKKIIKALFGGLVLGIALATLFPCSFLRDNAERIYSFTDIRMGNLTGLFILCSFFIYFFSALRSLVGRVNKRDMLQVISESYSNIDTVYRRSFWIIFGVLCFAFGFHAIQFMWGNHDWFALTNPQRWVHFPGIGRYALSFFRKLSLNGIYLPLIYDIISFLFLALNAVLLCVYWRLQKRIAYFVLCGLILTAQPFTLSLIYYVHMLPETFIGGTFVLVALIISEKIAFEKSALLKKSALSFLAIVLINLSLATYPVLLNTIAVAFAGRLLIKSFEWDGSWKQVKIYFFPFSVSVLNIGLGILSYKVMLASVFSPNGDMYNVQMLPLHQIPERLLILLQQSFHQLCEYNFPFISQRVLWVFLGFTILIALHICLTGNIKQKIVRLILLGGALYATQTAMIIANKHVIAGRVELFGLVVFETLVVVLTFTRLKELHNLATAVAAGVVWVSVVNDLDCLRAWKLGFDAEKMLWNRVLARMEIQKDFDAKRKYKIVQIGMPISLRPRFYGRPLASKHFHDNGSSLLTMSYDAPWDLFLPHEFYYQEAFRGARIRADRLSNPSHKAQLKRLWEAGILDKAQVWPRENGLIVWKDVILFVTDAKALENCKKQLAKEFPRQPQKTP